MPWNTNISLFMDGTGNHIEVGRADDRKVPTTACKQKFPAFAQKIFNGRSKCGRSIADNIPGASSPERTALFGAALCQPLGARSPTFPLSHVAYKVPTSPDSTASSSSSGSWTKDLI